MFYFGGTEIRTMVINADDIADALESAPAWAKIAFTMPSPRLREDARQEIGRHLYEAIFPEAGGADQLKLPL